MQLLLYLCKVVYCPKYNTNKFMSIARTAIKKLKFLGAAIADGQLLQGVEKGPSLIRNSRVLDMIRRTEKIEVTDLGDVKTTEQDRTKYPSVPFAVRNLNVLGPVLGRLHQTAYQAMKDSESTLVTVGGDHSIASSTISAVKRVHQDLRVVWVDAHPDFTDSWQRNPDHHFSENYHGMPLSHITGATSIPDLHYWHWLTKNPKLDPRNVVLIGIRDIDTDEFKSLKKLGVRCYSMDHIQKFGIGEVMSQTIDYLDPNDKHPFHISFDVDATDPYIATQTGTRYRYGLEGRESVHIVRRLAHQRKVVSLDITQINEDLAKDEPIRSKLRGQTELESVSQTVGLGVDLITSLFSKQLTV